jgi:hypothetical protein
LQKLNPGIEPIFAAGNPAENDKPAVLKFPG